MRRLKLLVVSTVMAVCAGVFGFAMPAQAATYLGGISVWNACVYQHGTPSYVVLVANNVYGWRCQYNGGWNAIYMGVDLSQECRRTHGPSAYATYTDYNNPYSWGCYR